MNKFSDLEPVTPEVLFAFGEEAPETERETKVTEVANELPNEDYDSTIELNPEILTGVVLTRCPVVSYNPYSKILVYERNGKLIQTNIIRYDGCGYVEVE